MQNYSRLSVAASSFFVLFAVGCAHPQTVTLTSAQAAVPAPAPVAPAPVAAAPEAAPAPEAAAGDAKPAKSDGPMTFEQLSAALGGEDKMGLEMQRTEQAPAGKGLSADGYSSVSAAHQAVDSSSSHLGGDITVSGGLTSVAVRAGVHTEAARLRACYEHGLAQNPHLAGRVTVSFSVDERGAVGDVDAQSDAIPGDVTSCIRQAFSAMTFSAPKAPPAKVVYPIDFNKDS
jgi:hypothetical protein